MKKYFVETDGGPIILLATKWKNEWGGDAKSSYFGAKGESDYALACQLLAGGNTFLEGGIGPCLGFFSETGAFDIFLGNGFIRICPAILVSSNKSLLDLTLETEIYNENSNELFYLDCELFPGVLFDAMDEGHDIAANNSVHAPGSFGGQPAVWAHLFEVENLRFCIYDIKK